MNQVAGKKIVPVVKASSTDPQIVDNARLSNLALKAKHEIDCEAENDRLVFLHAAIFGIGWRANFKQITTRFLERAQMQMMDKSEYVCQTCNLSDKEVMVCPQCGEQMQRIEQQVEEPVLGEDGQPVVDQIPICTPVSEVIDPFRIMVSNSYTKAKRKWLIEQSMQPVRWVKKNFMVKAKGFTNLANEKVKKTKYLPRALRISEDLRSVMEVKNSALYSTVTSSEQEFNNDEDTSLFYKAYLEPMDGWPKGRLLVFTPDVLLYDGLPDVPLRSKRIRRWHGYTDYVYDIHPMNSEGVPYIGDLIPKNKIVNAIDAMILEHLDKTAAPEEVRFDNVKTNNDDNADGILVIDAIPNLPQGGAPFYLQHPQIANETYNYRKEQILEMEKLGNVSEVAQGLRPEGVDTFRGLKFLRQVSESTEGDKYMRYNEYVKEYSQLKLALIQECLIARDEELIDMMKVINENEGNSETQIESFLGNAVGDKWNMTVEQSEYLNTVKGAEEESVEQAIKDKIISPEDMQDPLLKFNLMQRLGMGHTVDTFMSEDIKKANWIIQLLESQKFDIVTKAVKSFDNKPLHLRVLISWMKKPKFYSLDPAIQAQAEVLRTTLETEMISNQSIAPKPGVGSNPSPSGARLSSVPPPASPSAITA